MSRKTGSSTGDESVPRGGDEARSAGETDRAGVVGLTPSREGLLVRVRVTPAARRTRFAGVYGDRLKVHVNAPPEHGRANTELAAAVAGWLGLPAECVTVHSGNKSKDKVLAFSGIAEHELRVRLQRLVAAVASGGRGR